ncbi:MAG: MAPEG family protein [Pseudomonadota bacterium]|nr:MAPEG family protein [Pseudomonadota bacterium]
MFITPLYAGLLAILFITLSVRVVQQRGHGVSLGHGEDQVLLRRIRGHGNFAEYVPFILLMMALLEVGGATPVWLLHALGITLVVARVLHGVALSYTEKWKFGRFYGTLLTFILVLVLGLLCLWRGVGGLALTLS